MSSFLPSFLPEERDQFIVNDIDRLFRGLSLERHTTTITHWIVYGIEQRFIVSPFRAAIAHKRDQFKITEVSKNICLIPTHGVDVD
tara:strand:- start:16 stop:273 length:258 start_codon:yes stop_codon:yes gene_type:complete